jgi:hypothetical protein
VEVGGQLHAISALTLGKGPPTHVRQEVRWPPKTVLEDVDERKFVYSCRELNPHRPNCGLVAISAQLSQLIDMTGKFLFFFIMIIPVIKQQKKYKR